MINSSNITFRQLCEEGGGLQKSPDSSILLDNSLSFHDLKTNLKMDFNVLMKTTIKVNILIPLDSCNIFSFNLRNSIRLLVYYRNIYYSKVKSIILPFIATKYDLLLDIMIVLTKCYHERYRSQ